LIDRLIDYDALPACRECMSMHVVAFVVMSLHDVHVFVARELIYKWTLPLK